MLVMLMYDSRTNIKDLEIHYMITGTSTGKAHDPCTILITEYFTPHFSQRYV